MDTQAIDTMRTLTTPAGRLTLAALLLIALSGGLPTAAAQASDRPEVFDHLVGTWRGEGTLMGRDAEFEMTWSLALAGQFVHLQFANAFVQASGTATPVISAAAYYRPGAPEAGQALGTWFDSRGITLPLRATVTATEIVTVWGDPDSAEQGRTTYRIVGPDRVEVIDEVMRDGAYASFGSASYTRVQ